MLSCLAVRLSPHRLTVPDLRQDLHYAVRVLRRNPGYALTAMVCLGLGIGVNATVFSMVNELFWQPLPVPQANRVVVIGRSGEEMTCSYRDFREFERRVAAPGGRVFSGLLAYDDLPTSLDVEGASQIIMAEAVSANFADTLRLSTQVGRWFMPRTNAAALTRWPRSATALGEPLRPQPGRDRPACAHRDAVVSHRRRRPGWIRRSLAAAHRADLGPVALATVGPETACQSRRARAPARTSPGTPRPGIAVRSTEAQVRTADERIRRDFPRDTQSTGALTVDVASGATMPAVREFSTMMATMLLSVTGIVLLIACVNVANLLLSRSAVRRREMAVRQALGAAAGASPGRRSPKESRSAAGGAVLGLAFGFWANRLLAQSVPALPHIGTVALDLTMNWRVAIFAAAAALTSAILFTISPALEHSRPDLTASLKADGAGLRRMRQRDAYVVAQVALSLVLLIMATLLVRALRHAQQIEPGFAMTHRLAARIYVSEPEYSPDSGKLFFARLLDTARATPGVRSATLSYTVPLDFSDSVCASPDTTSRPRRSASNVVVPGYFDTIGIPIVRGRQFTVADQPGSPRVVIVSQSYVNRYWPHEDPIGKTVWLGCDPKQPRDMAEVIGVAKDAQYESLDEAPRPFVYRPLAQDWVGFMALIVETSGSPADFTAAVARHAPRPRPRPARYEIRTLEDYASGSLWKIRWQATLMAVFGGLAMLLAAVGLYGVVAYTVAQRTREIGVRLAMGAQRGDVLWMVLGRGLGLTAVGIVVGLALSAWRPECSAACSTASARSTRWHSSSPRSPGPPSPCWPVMSRRAVP